ncbi:hypothetical protein BDN71DRAFT_1434545 [Pleurotus eryngii]|uniref:Uncharacterized protein n=1 Tax=Pleurotus eryngii TaxID=5323 RepID=A0A9P5ZN81_PLEER|nr:hypothetical protein BDN71DRAFT_1434545 [Pleurotus eryngii]
MSMPLGQEIASLSLQDEGPLNLIDKPLEHDAAATFVMVANSLGLARLPWFVPIEILDLCHMDDCRRKLLQRQLFKCHWEIRAWVSDPYREDNRASLALCSILTHTLLAYMEGDRGIDRYLCDGVRLANGCIKFSTGLSDTVTKLYDWPSSILDKALWAMETECKKQTKGSTESIPSGDDSVSNLFSIFNKYKRQGLYAKILSNIVITAMGLRYSMEDEVTNIPGLNAGEILEYKSQYIILSPLVLLMTKDLMGKSMSRHWHLLMWMSLGSARPQQLAEYESIIWTAVHHIAKRPSEVESSMRLMFDRLKEMAHFDPRVKENNFGLSSKSTNFFAKLAQLIHSPATTADDLQSIQRGPSNSSHRIFPPDSSHRSSATPTSYSALD